ncbi:regulator [Streptomyces sp. NPDC055078]
MTTRLAADQVTQTVEVIGHPGVIRLVTEIDDHGPVPRHMLSRTFPDLPRQQIRDGSVLAREHRLVRTGQQARQPAYQLTDHGTALADVYDTAARWARANDYPTRVGDFTTRVRATLALLSADHDQKLPDGLGDLREALSAWTAGGDPGAARA